VTSFRTTISPTTGLWTAVYLAQNAAKRLLIRREHDHVRAAKLRRDVEPGHDQPSDRAEVYHPVVREPRPDSSSLGEAGPTSSNAANIEKAQNGRAVEHERTAYSFGMSAHLARRIGTTTHQHCLRRGELSSHVIAQIRQLSHAHKLAPPTDAGAADLRCPPWSGALPVPTSGRPEKVATAGPRGPGPNDSASFPE
jgi:hypothetical protein